MKRLLALLVIALPALAMAGDTNLPGRLIIQDGDDAPTCSTAAADGALCIEGAVEAQSTLLATGAVTMSSTLAVTGATTMTGGATLGGALSCGDNNITNVGDIALDTISSDGSTIGIVGDTLTTGGTDDYALTITGTLNDTGAAGGTDVYRGLKMNITTTDITGWDNVYLMDLQDTGTSRFSVSDTGAVVTGAGITAGGDLDMSGNELYAQLMLFEDLTGNDTMDGDDCGRVITTNDDNRVITLPDTAAGNKGCAITFVVTAAADAAKVSISPHSSDGVYGNCCGVNDAATTACVALSGTADKDLECQKAEQNKGDSVTLVSDGSTGWYTVGCVGAGWASES